MSIPNSIQRTFSRHKNQIINLIENFGTRIVTEGGRVVHIWDDLQKGTLSKTIDLKEHISSIKPIENNIALAFWGLTCNVFILDPETCEYVQKFNGHTGPVRAIEVLGNKIISGSTDKTIQTWNQMTGKSLSTWKAPWPVSCIRTIGNKILGCDPLETKSGLCIWAETGNLDTIAIPEIYCVEPIDDNTILHGALGKIGILDLRKNHSIHLLSSHLSPIEYIGSLSGNALIGIANLPGKSLIQVWDFRKPEILSQFESPAPITAFKIVNNIAVVGLTNGEIAFLNYTPEKPTNFVYSSLANIYKSFGNARKTLRG